MMPPMQLLSGASILGLGESPSSLGTDLALILTFVIIIGGVANLLIAYIIGQVFVERRQNKERQRNYDAS
jgi:hypothetical protein